jgi:ABC-type amino acid transport substrate-binding protein
MRQSIVFWFLLVFAFSSQAAESQNWSDSVLTIGVKSAAPFLVQLGDEPEGLSVAFWQEVQEKEQMRYAYRNFDDIASLLSALEQGEVDMSINPITVSEERMHVLDFSQPFFISGTAMVHRRQSSWMAFFDNLFSWRFFSAVGVLLAVIFIFGLLVWILERRKNPEQFKAGWRGVMDGFWWSAVTMTTVGYGDKAPVSTGGRVVGFIWMFTAILLISGLTAGVASALTVSSLENEVDSIEDLRRFKTATVAGSSTEDFLDKYDLPDFTYASISEALDALENKTVDYVIFDRPVLAFHLKQRDNDQLVIDPQDLKTDYYSFAFPKGNGLRNKLDPAIVEALKSDRWQLILRQNSNQKNH